MIFEKTGHGGDIYGMPIRLDFSVNINPLGTPETVRRAVINAASRIYQYPDPCCRKLVRKIAEYEGVAESNIMCGCGAAELIFSFCAAVRPQKALELAPTFSEYSMALDSVDCKTDRYILKQEDGFALTKSFLSAIEEKCWDAVFLCNPNNPTGRLISPELLEKICRICAETKTRLFLDECFLDLSSGGKNGMKHFIEQFPELFVLKAFTKNYGMAGLRLGYCLCSDKMLLQRMSKVVQVWNVSLPAQEAGIAALEESAFLEQAKAIIFHERVFLDRELRALGFWVCPTEANYILFHSGKPLGDALLEQGILIRDCANYHGLGKGWYRIAVKRHEENEVLVSALRHIMGA